MLTFFEYLAEARRKSSKAAEEEDEDEFSPGDSAGKIWEILKGMNHNGGKYADSFREEGKRPEDIHKIHATKNFGDQYENHPIYNNMRNSADESSEMLERYLAGKYGHDRSKGFGRVHWTSQTSDPTKFLGKKAAKSVADTMVDLSNGNPHSISEKVTAVNSPVNYANPGAKTFEGFAGLAPGSLTKHNAAHEKTMADIMKTVKTGETQKAYIKRITKKAKDPRTELGLTPTEMKHREAVISSYNERNKNYGRDMRAGLAKIAKGKDGDTKLRDAIFNLVTPSRETPTTVSHTELNPDGTVHRHRAYDVHDHVNQYLDQFQKFHIKQSDDDPASVTIHAEHKTAKDKDGKPLTLPIANLAVYGRKHDKSPRGSTNLRSENHPSVVYQNELDSHGKAGHSYDQYAKDMPQREQPSAAEQKQALAAQTPEQRQNMNNLVGWLSKQGNPAETQNPGIGGRGSRVTGTKMAPEEPVQSPFQTMPAPGISSFSKFRPQQKANPAQSQGGFANVKNPKVQRVIDPHEHKQYVSGEHGGLSFRGPGDM